MQRKNAVREYGMRGDNQGLRMGHGVGEVCYIKDTRGNSYLDIIHSFSKHLLSKW